VLTFGPVGRVVVTGALFAVLAWFLLLAGVYGLVGAVIWATLVMPRALRDTWRPAALPATDLTRLRDEAAREAENQRRERPDHPVFDPEQPPPTRW